MHLLLLHHPSDSGQAESLVEVLRDPRFDSIKGLELFGGAASDGGWVDRADIVLILLSESFILAADKHDETLDDALGRATEDHYHLLGVVLENCDWESGDFRALDVVPEGGIPLNRINYWRRPERALQAVREQLNERVDLYTLKRDDLESYIRMVSASTDPREGPSLTRLALRLAWAALPLWARWGLAVLAVGGVGALVWLLTPG